MSDFKIVSQPLLKKAGITLSEYLSMVLILYNPNIIITIDLSSLLELGYLNMNEHDGYSITKDGIAAIKSIELMASVPKVNSAEIKELAEELREIFPKGKKDGTNRYWRDSSAVVAKKLSAFYKEYGYHEKDVILNAARKYVSSFGNSKTLMRVLPYFIEKDGQSELATIIENIDSVGSDTNNDLWASTLI